MKTDHRLNKLEKKIELLFSKKTNAIGFGKSSIDEKKRKLLLFIESESITKDHSNTIDGIILTNLEPASRMADSSSTNAESSRTKAEASRTKAEE